MTYKPKPPAPENINRSQESPLFSFASLAFSVISVFVVVLIALMVLGQVVSKVIPLEWEHKLAHSYFKQLKEDPSAIGAYSQLTNQLWKNSVLNSALSFSPAVIAGPPNAFILPGGQIYLTEELIQQTKSENELSFVLCHELGHFYHRHTLTGLNQMILKGSIRALTGLGSELEALTDLLVTSGFSRSQESQADEFAIDCLFKRYNHVAGYSHFFEKIKNIEKGSRFKYFRSHPITEERINSLKKTIRSKGYGLEGELAPLKTSDL